MEKRTPPWTLSQVALMVQGELHGPPDAVIESPVSAGDSHPCGITFAQDDHYLELAEASSIAAVIVGRQMAAKRVPYIRVDNPKVAFLGLLQNCDSPTRLDQGIHSTAVVHPSAKIAPTARIGALAVIAEGSTIGDDTEIYPHSYIGANCKIGSGGTIHANVSIYANTEIGDRVIVHSGTVIASDGFGFVFDGKRQIKVPQIGRVIIGSDVEIGANTTIDRATTGATVIGDGVKLDNQIQIGHNTTVGDHTVIAGGVGVAGSVHIGARNIIGGATIFRDHVSTTDDVVLGGATGVDRDITEPGIYFGQPAQPISQAKRVFLLIPKLPELFKRIRDLERKVGKGND
ncbi:MAG: UDP-3-O-(3-hydroxymyristoyl)glucosamine N-acyltransferase [Fimbriimonadaceae bacterium]|nr:UDP-3-O-(3-hydroxymyristoyl)glucosamine N-acyltransferase [Fimbriimonadaceae bacterium]